MREIKFRVFDTKEKTMITHFKGARIDYVLNYFETHKHVSEVMQYIEMNDCKGIEIYEGDIIKIKDIVQLKVVKYSRIKSCYILNTINIFSESFFIHEVNNNIEVIGNIYENHELLK